jgi:hypothetical protein
LVRSWAGLCPIDLKKLFLEAYPSKPSFFKLCLKKIGLRGVRAEKRLRLLKKAFKKNSFFSSA